MPIQRLRIKRTRLIQTEYVVAVEIELVVPNDGPSEPCLESETVDLLREVKENADKQDLEWLKEHGKVYSAIKAG